MPVGNCRSVSECLYRLFTDDALYANISQNAEQEVNGDYFTPANLMAWLWMGMELYLGRWPGHEQWVRVLWQAWYDKQKQSES